MREFRKMVAWQKAHAVAVDICRTAVAMPHRYVRISDQLVGAAISIAANLAESCGRHTDADRARFVGYASGSACELEALVLIARDLGQLDEAEADRYCTRISEVRAMTYALRAKLKSARRHDAGRKSEGPTRSAGPSEQQNR